MKKRILIFSISIFVINFLSVDLFAGAVSGGGDKSVVCRELDNKIVSAQTLDLYEAQYVYGLNVNINPQKSVDEILTDIKSSLVNTMEQPEVHLIPLLNRVQRIIKFVPQGVELKPIDDAAELVLPAGCNIEQLAHYVDDDLLLVSFEIWNVLSNADKAALLMHEAIYRMERTYGALNSRRTRKFISYLFSGVNFENVKLGIPESATFCRTLQGEKVTNRFYYYPSKDNQMTVVQFLWLNGLPVYSKKTMILPFVGLVPRNSDGLCTDMGEFCNLVGGETKSLFESHDSIVLGVQKITESGIEIKNLFMETSRGRHIVKCDKK